jgi:serine-type D-Ala-D-Ala carboxypeptidase/endopeptidase
MNVLRVLLTCAALTMSWVAAAVDLAPGGNGGNDAQVRELGRSWLERNEGVGMSIGIYDGGEQRFYNFGTTQLDGNRQPTKDTVYEIAQISKTFAGQLLARAIVEGRANPNDEVERYLGEAYPNFTKDGEKMLLIHLANMTSQLVDNIPDLTQVRLVPGEPLAATRMRVFERYTPTEFLMQLHRVGLQRTPGSDPSHSNVASMLLGVVLEKIYGESFDAMLASEIEKPLHMGSGTQPDVKLLARGYTRTNEGLPAFGAKIVWPTSSLRYSTADLLRYASWQLVERDASVKLAHQPTWSTPDKRESVAFYWVVSDTPRGRRLQSSGSTFGFASVVELYPDLHLALVLLSNKAADGAQDNLRALSAKIVDVLRPNLDPRPADVPPAAR